MTTVIVNHLLFEFIIKSTVTNQNGQSPIIPVVTHEIDQHFDLHPTLGTLFPNIPNEGSKGIIPTPPIHVPFGNLLMDHLDL